MVNFRQISAKWSSFRVQGGNPSRACWAMPGTDTVAGGSAGTRGAARGHRGAARGQGQRGDTALLPIQGGHKRQSAVSTLPSPVSASPENGNGKPLLNAASAETTESSFRDPVG